MVPSRSRRINNAGDIMTTDHLHHLRTLYQESTRQDPDLLMQGYLPENLIQLAGQIKTLFPVGLPDGIRVYCNYIPKETAPRRQVVQYYEEASNRFSCIERAGSMHHLYTMLGGTVNAAYINKLADDITKDADTNDIRSVFVAIPADDAIMQEKIMKRIKQRTGYSLTALRAILKSMRTLGKQDDLEEWDTLVVELRSQSGYAYLSTGKRDEGYWVREIDQISSLHEFNVHFDIMEIAREKLVEIQKIGTSMVNELLQQFKEKQNFKIDDFEPDDNIIHFRNGVYFIHEDYFLDRYAPPENLPVFVQEYNLHTFTTLPGDYDPTIPLEIEDPAWATWEHGWYLQEFRHAFEYYFNGDENVMNRWWEWFGYTLTNYIFFKKAAIYHGESDCGKSQFAEIHQACIGDEWVQHSFHQICENELGISGSLYRKKVCYDDDLGDARIKRFEKFKQVTGFPTMEVRDLYQSPFTGKNTVKFMCAANVLPPVKNLDIPFCNRWLIFFFKNIIPLDERDVFFATRMRHPRVISYMYRKGIHHLRQLLHRGYFIGMQGKEVMHWWELGSNIVYRFVHECCKKVETIAESDVQADLYQAFCTYSDASNMKATWVKGQPTFTSQLKKFGHPAVPAGHREREDDTGNVRSTSVKVYTGLAVDQDKLDAIIDKAGTRKPQPKTKAPPKKSKQPTLLQPAPHTPTTPPAPAPAPTAPPKPPTRMEKELEQVYHIIKNLNDHHEANKEDRHATWKQIQLAAQYQEIIPRHLDHAITLLTDHVRIVGNKQKGYIIMI